MAYMKRQQIKRLDRKQIEIGEAYKSGLADGAKIAWRIVKNELGEDHPLAKKLWNDYRELYDAHTEWAIAKQG